MSIKRNRAWRRFKNTIKSGKGVGRIDQLKPEKNWKLIYTRSCKLARAKQLGFDYPRKSQRELFDKEFALNNE